MWALLFAFLAGAGLSFGFAPFTITALSFIAPAVLFWLCLQAKPARSFLVGLFFGLGFGSVGVSWVYISIHTYGNASPPLAIFITSLLIVTFSLYYAISMYLARRLFQNKSVFVQSVFVLPSFWLIFEVLRADLVTHFPWLLLGYTQQHSPLVSLTPIIGVYGLSLLTAMIAGALVVLSHQSDRMTPKLWALLIITFPMCTGWLFANKNWTVPVTSAMPISLIQGNIRQEMKWDSRYLNEILTIYKNETESVWKSRLIIWPEAAIPAFPEQVSSFSNMLDTEAKKHNATLVIGLPIQKNNHFYNGLMIIGKDSGEYLKRRLVPFGEYLPYKFIFGALISKLEIPMADFTPGPVVQATLKIGQTTVAPFICYEIAFPMAVLHYAKNAQLLINISDDSWFGDSIALDQQIQMAQFRAMELGKPVLSSTNTGITAVINKQGKLIQSLPVDTQSTLSTEITPQDGDTPLAKWQYWPTWSIALLLLIISVFSPSTLRVKRGRRF